MTKKSSGDPVVDLMAKVHLQREGKVSPVPERLRKLIAERRQRLLATDPKALQELDEASSALVERLTKDQ